MLSTGNDIVSLNTINVTRTKQPNFYSKILTPTETALYKQSRFANTPFEVFVWLLWSIKESAFKFLQRIDTDILFTPVKFEVSEIQIPFGFNLTDFKPIELTGIGFDGIHTIKSTIKFDDLILYSNSSIYQEFISTVVNGVEDFSNTHWGVKQIDSDEVAFQSAEVRAFLIDNFKDNTSISIGKNPFGIPIILKDNIEQPIPVSLSHHEYYIAYSFQLPV
ncbi:4'-phosphopantetheinyl transferase superfamily protein [Mucilaginibacter sp. L196]|uniref:4'-phosphopantetheinyl transferase family protein n=1 Tax=Mucilaginibacter sp. L196 TaxID=1641870 RepID=UPI00131E22C9|nr:4'-phosphopantetheinyl transferase superfamily protein [Mucilaginibacter sp. L196]